MTDSLGPVLLWGLRVVTLAVNVPGPAAAARLRELGASVIKIEPPGGDPLSRSNPTWYEALAAGQEVIRLDLKDATDRNRLDELLAEANVLLAVAALEERFWKNLLLELGLEEVTRENLAEVFSHKTAKKWEE